MSDTYNIHEAKTNLSKLIARAEAGEEIYIARAGKPVVKVSKADDAPRKSRQPGGWEGKVWYAKDWEETDPEMIDAFINGPVFPDEKTSS